MPRREGMSNDGGKKRIVIAHSSEKVHHSTVRKIFVVVKLTLFHFETGENKFLSCNNFQSINQPTNQCFHSEKSWSAGLILFQVKVEKHWVFLHLPFYLMAALLSHYSLIILSHPCVGCAFTTFIIVFFSLPFLCIWSCFVFFCASKK